ncbi:hypothetical protein AB0O07_04585 [Streptomyces sp. NPDC093085]|uniref:hypothetical protein n=1 Tax=Streptomyces sp. NPDC093085 TaxID=3155068 RepID=UPI003423432A
MRATDGPGTSTTGRLGRRARAVLAGAALLLPAGCASGTVPPFPPPATVTYTVPPPGVPHPAPDRTGCADADCEAELTPGETLAFGRGAAAGRLAITALDGAEVSWELPGARQCGASGPGNIRMHGDGGGCRGTVGAGTDITANGVRVTFVRVGAGTVRVRLTPGPAGDHPALRPEAAPGVVSAF